RPSTWWRLRGAWTSRPCSTPSKASCSAGTAGKASAWGPLASSIPCPCSRDAQAERGTTRSAYASRLHGEDSQGACGPKDFGRIMAPAVRYYAPACQTDLPNPTSRAGIARQVNHMLAMIDRAVVGYAPFFPVRLVVFPEFAHAAPVYPTAQELLDRLAVPIPNEHTDRYRQKAREHNVYVQTGSFLESDARYPGAVFNTTCLIGPEGLLARYRKVNPWIPWEVHASPHDLPGYADELFPVAETEIGRLGAATCYDWLFPECIRQLALQGAEVLVRVSAYMDPW